MVYTGTETATTKGHSMTQLYATFFYWEGINFATDGPRQRRRAEYIVLPPDPAGSSDQLLIYYRDRRGPKHRAVWKSVQGTSELTWIKQQTEQVVHNADWILKHPIVVRVSAENVTQSYRDHKAPYYVINVVKRVLGRRGDVV